MTMHNAQRGFSLAELLIVLQFSAILGVIAVPKVNAFFAEYQLVSAADELAFDIARARMQAVGQNQYVHIKRVSQTQYTRETSTDASNWTNSVNTTLPRGATFVTSSAEVRFDKRGLATVNNSITVKNNNNQQKTIATNPIGRVTISNVSGN
jgi:Tfp pilus assembly protein FimT